MYLRVLVARIRYSVDKVRSRSKDTANLTMIATQDAVEPGPSIIHIVQRSTRLTTIDIRISRNLKCLVADIASGDFDVVLA